MAVHAGKQENEPRFFRQSLHGPLQPSAEFVRRRNVFRGRPRCVDRPKGFPLLTTSCGTRLVQSQSKGDSDQPRPKSGWIAKASKTPVSSEQGLLRDIFGVIGIAQDSTRDPEGQRAAFLKTLLEFAPEGNLLPIERQLGLRRATGPGKFLHPFSPYKLPDATVGLWVRLG